MRAREKIEPASKPAGGGSGVTLRLTSEEETGADHFRHDSPALGQKLMIDWRADRFKLDVREPFRTAVATAGR